MRPIIGRFAMPSTARTRYIPALAVIGAVLLGVLTSVIFRRRPAHAA
jgi:hypothetical protein